MTLIEPADNDDLDELADLWVDLVASQREHGTHLLASPNRTAARDVLGRYVTAGDVLVARDTQIQGFVMYHVQTGLYQQDQERGVIDNVYVRPAVRDQGLGSALLTAAEDALIEAGVDVLSISVLAANDRARALYERHGYTTHRLELERTVGSDNDSSHDPE
ncbi:MAG: GNAT family N-acetyltransferase [Halobacteriaceae archaeon]